MNSGVLGQERYAATLNAIKQGNLTDTKYKQRQRGLPVHRPQNRRMPGVFKEQQGNEHDWNNMSKMNYSSKR